MVEFSNLFSGEPAELALLSTFQFDPDYFERRLLRQSALSSARRIAVLVDRQEWAKLHHREIRAKYLNRRYLVVPVGGLSGGVFHPKLNLLINDTGAKVLCGSTNLTRSGCTSNLEIINALTLDLANPDIDAMAIVSEAFRFFEAATKTNDSETGQILAGWLSEIGRRPWLREESQGESQLVHSYKRPLWEELESAIEGDPVNEFLIVSPFHDKQCGLEKRLVKRWPSAKVKLVVQQHYTNLNAELLEEVDNCSLSELANSSRRLHAKLIAWRTETGSGCIVGSANFTSAAFDGRNVEASLLIPNTWEQCMNLFGGGQRLTNLAFDKFESGDSKLPEDTPVSRTPIFIESAVLKEGILNLKIRCRSDFSSPMLSIRAAGELNPREKRSPTNRTANVIKHQISESTMADSPGTLLVSIEAQVDGANVTSPPTWIVQERQLTHESGGGSKTSERKIRETGEGLAEFLDAIAERDGAAAAASFLRQLTIGYSVGARSGSVRSFRIKIQDPFRVDCVPDWITGFSSDQKEDESEAFFEFYKRHERTRIRKHANTGNINGMANFADIFHTILQLMAIRHKRGIIPAGKLISKVGRLIQLATLGTDDDYGFLDLIWYNVGRDTELMNEVCDETGFLAELRAAMIFVQHLRLETEPRDANGVPSKEAHQLLTNYSGELTKVITECELDEPTREQVADVFKRYGCYAPEEIEAFLETFDLSIV